MRQKPDISEVTVFKVSPLQLAGSWKYSTLKALLQAHMKNYPEAHKSNRDKQMKVTGSVQPLC